MKFTLARIINHDGYGGYAEHMVVKESETALKPKID